MLRHSFSRTADGRVACGSVTLAWRGWLGLAGVPWGTADSDTVRPQPSQLSPHRAVRVEFPGPYGPIVALHAEARATDRPGPPAIALLVPGYTGSKEDFAPLLDPIADAGIAVAAVDLPGQYESAGSTAEADYLPDPLGEVIADLVRVLAAERRVLLLGHSYGGLVARGAVLAGAPITGLTLLDSGPAELPEGARRAALDVGEPVLRIHGIDAAHQVKAARDGQNPARAEQPPELQALLRERFVRSAPAGLLGMADGLRYEPDLVPQLAKTLQTIGAPVLVMCGESDDAWTVADQRDMAERLDADFAVIPGAAHSPNTENPDGLLGPLLSTWRTWLV